MWNVMVSSGSTQAIFYQNRQLQLLETCLHFSEVFYPMFAYIILGQLGAGSNYELFSSQK